MPFSQEKKYLLDGDPLTASELIAAAAAINEPFAKDWFKQTSIAAHILRNNGHTIEINPEVEPILCP
jgi:hypothetical protein